MADPRGATELPNERRPLDAGKPSDEGKPRVLVLTGPTTSGKTALSLAVARRLNGEIVSADSRQVYRGMDIGTDKVDLRDRATVPHHGLDRLDPDERYSAGRFQRDATRAIRGIVARGRIPIVVGGTGFFINALRNPLFTEPDLDTGAREKLEGVLGEWDRDRLERAVRVLDPSRAEVATEGGRQRMIRTIEVALLTGVPLSTWHQTTAGPPPAFQTVTVVLELARDELDRRINARVSRMVERGFVEEVDRLIAAGFDRNCPGMTSTGYREVASFLAGEGPLDEALESMRIQTRRYARRQMTWFRHQIPDAAIVSALDIDERIRAVETIWRGGER